ncbi:hypothetical protein [Bifidobacterium longum]|uniref:hypothetical protein n=1 Tax=Bifidobacterium longum TaxID=216816 RepID=UPI0018A03027|nr:hypothetical protein [Bifidobacterium longum]MDB6790042.1 hypothetical protein [Bifidobacterium longum]
MPTHVSQSVRELKELGRNLYAAMRSDFEVNSNASALPLDYFERIVTWYQAHKGDATMMDDVMEACGRAGLSASDADELRDYADTLFQDGKLKVERLWELTSESMDEWGDSTPVPSRYADAKKC